MQGGDHIASMIAMSRLGAAMTAGGGAQSDKRSSLVAQWPEELPDGDVEPVRPFSGARYRSTVRPNRSCIHLRGGMRLRHG